MKILSPTINLADFFQSLGNARHRVLFLDYDGTLAPFHIQPEEAYPYPGVPQLLEDLCRRTMTRVVFVTGRAIDDLLPLLEVPGGAEVWGSHGLERLKPDGSREIPLMPERAREGLEQARAWLRKSDLALRGEEKPGCLALHWRGVEQEAIDALDLLAGEQWSRIAREFGLECRRFDGGLELRVPGRNKGDSVETVLAEMNQHPVAAYLGDDLTDEDAFRAIKGKGLGVLVRNEFRPTAADLWLQPPEELVAFLTRWIKESSRDDNRKRGIGYENGKQF